jgi:Leucine-rich repeat (LRR) protein
MDFIWTLLLAQLFFRNIIISAATCKGPISANEYNALESLYYSTRGHLWHWNETDLNTTIWNFPSTPDTPCTNSWQGLGCRSTGETNCSVVSIDLQYFNLRGALPTYLGQISTLQYLILNNNCLTGTIPTEIGNLLRLQQVNLSITNVTGVIPTEIGLLSELQQLRLFENSLVGSIPTELGMMQALQQLYLDVNSLTGPIPTQLGLLSNLTDIGLDVNELEGIIPTELGQLSRILWIFLDDNHITGVIPTEIGRLEQLEQLYLNINYLSGSISSFLGQLFQCQQLGVYANALTNTIPTELGLLSNMQDMYLYTNYLSGPVATELGSLTKIQVLGLCNNTLSGAIPTELGLLSNIQVLTLNTNHITGSIPSELGYATSFQQLSLEVNDINGPIPSQLGLLSNLQQLYLNENCLTATIPAELGYLSRLKVVSFGDNYLDRTIPTELGSLELLEQIYLEQNLLSGTIPSELRQLTSMQTMILFDNALSGNLMWLENMADVQEVNVSANLFTQMLPLFPGNTEFLDISTNYFSGSLGSSMEACINMRFLVAGMNYLTGTIVSYFPSMSNLQALNLSFNLFTGDTNQCFLGRANSSLQVLDFSSNRLSGNLPSTLFVQSSLQTVLLFSNCFSGAIPSDLCSNHRLETLFLDDLTGNCLSKVPTSLKHIIRGWFPSQLMSGGIPSCIWSMPNLQLLQLSGDGLTGTLGDLNANRNLTMLLLASNRLTGHIPSSFQTSGQFVQLDLSGNKLSGTLDPDLSMATGAVVFDLSVNRLSGGLPAAFQNASALNVLNGNLFQCQQGNVPSGDPNHATYVCGSSNFNLALEFAVIAFGCSGIAFNFVPHNRRLFSEGTNVEKYFLVSLRKYTVFLAGLSCAQAVIGIMVYVTLKMVPYLAMFPTHTDQYTWTSTVSYLHGWVPTVLVLLIVLASLGLAWMWEGNIASRKTSKRATVPLYKLCAMHMGHMIVIVLVNGSYVYATLNGLSQKVLFVIQFFLGCFKLAWSSVVIPKVVSFIFGADDGLVHTVYMTLFSFIGGPFISTFFTSSNCFLNVFVGESQIQSRSALDGYYCENVCPLVCSGDECYEYCTISCGFSDADYIDIAMTPPWIYSYQCSSVLINEYVPVLIITYTISGAIIPLIWFIIPQQTLSTVAQWLPQSTTENSVLVAVGVDAKAKLQQGSKPFSCGRSERLKFLLGITVLMTFGIACPLLAVVVAADTISKCGLLHCAIGRLAEQAADEDSRATVLRRLMLSTGAQLSNEYLIVYSFVGIFWSLFVLDMFGDVYGGLAGGMMMLVPLLAPVPFWLLRYNVVDKSRQLSTALASNVSNLLGLELRSIQNAAVVISPQLPNEKFEQSDLESKATSVFESATVATV